MTLLQTSGLVYCLAGLGVFLLVAVELKHIGFESTKDVSPWEVALICGLVWPLALGVYLWGYVQGRKNR
jgi:hypothetical protein